MTATRDMFYQEINAMLKVREELVSKFREIEKEQIKITFDEEKLKNQVNWDKYFGRIRVEEKQESDTIEYDEPTIKYRKLAEKSKEIEARMKELKTKFNGKTITEKCKQYSDLLMKEFQEAKEPDKQAKAMDGLFEVYIFLREQQEKILDSFPAFSSKEADYVEFPLSFDDTGSFSGKLFQISVQIFRWSEEQLKSGKFRKEIAENMKYKLDNFNKINNPIWLILKDALSQTPETEKQPSGTIGKKLN